MRGEQARSEPEKSVQTGNHRPTVETQVHTRNQRPVLMREAERREGRLPRQAAAREAGPQKTR